MNYLRFIPFRIILQCCFLVFYTNVFSQESIFIPSWEYLDDQKVRDYSVKFDNPEFESGLEKAKEVKAFGSLCFNKKAFFNQLVEGNYFFTDEKISIGINEILSKLIESNPALFNRSFEIVLYRGNSVNAASLAEGLIFINIGLLERIQTEDELAFVIAHEMSHDIIQHCYKKFVRLAKTQDAVEKDLKKASRAYNNDKGESPRILYEEILKSNLATSRDNEVGADSLAIILLKSSPYQLSAALDLLDVLDSSEYFHRTDNLDVIGLLSTKEFAVDSSFIKLNSDAPLWLRNDSHYVIPDEFKTHPDVKVRKNLITSWTGLNQGLRSENSKLQLFENISLHVIEVYLQEERYALALYNALSLLDTMENNSYLHAVVAHSFLELSKSIKGRYFSECVPFPSEIYPASFNILLNMLHGMTSSECLDLYKSYYKNRQEFIFEEEYREFLCLYLLKNKDDLVLSTEEVNNFINKYPKSRFRSYLSFRTN